MNNEITVAALRRVNYLLERLATKTDYHDPEEVQKDIDEAKDLVRQELERYGEDNGTRKD